MTQAVILQQAGDLASPVGILLLLLIGFVGAVGIIYLWRRRSRQALMARVAELETLADAGRNLLSSELDLDELCRLIATEAGAIVDTQTFQLGLVEERSFRHLVARYRGVTLPEIGRIALDNLHPLLHQVATTQKPAIEGDLSPTTGPPFPAVTAATSPMRSGLVVPLVSGETTLGLMAAWHPRRNAFSEEELRRMTILANQGAAAIANAILFERERVRAADLAMVSDLSNQVNELQEMDQIFKQVVDLIRERLGFHPVTILDIDPDNNDIVVRASSAATLEPESIRIPSGTGLIGTAASTRQVTLVTDVKKDDRYIQYMGEASYDAAASGTLAEIALPLLVNDDVLGVLDVQRSTAYGFTAREQALLTAVANETAAALDKARQITLQREQAWLTTAQLQLSRAINRSRNLRELGEKVTRLIQLLLGVDQCGLLIWNSHQSVYLPFALHGARDADFERFMAGPIALGQWGALDAAHVGRELRETMSQPPWQTRKDRRPSQLYPLQVQDQLFGVLLTRGTDIELPGSSVGRKRRHQRRHELLNMMAGQVAQAVARMQWQRAQQEEAWVNTALLQVAEAVNSLVDLNEILHTIVRLVPMLLGVRSCVILIWDEASGTFRSGPSHGVSEMGLGLIDSFDFNTTEFVSMRSHPQEQRTQTPVYRALLPNWLQRVLEAEYAAAIPLVARNQLVGALVIDEPRHGPILEGRRLNILTGVGQQAAIAVVNDQLYQESAERDRLEREIEVARGIQASLIPSSSPDIPNCDVAAAWHAARQVSGDFYDFLQLPDGRWGIVIADVADKGIPAALFMALCRTILRSVAISRTDPADMLARANEIIYKDTESDLFVTVCYAIWDPATNQLSYANGGHNPPIIVSAAGDVSILRMGGIALGVIDAFEFETHTVTLQPDDVFVMFTDGVTDATDAALNEFGDDRLKHTVVHARQQTSRAIVNAIIDAVEAFAGEAAQHDDLTLVVLKHVDKGTE